MAGEDVDAAHETRGGPDDDAIGCHGALVILASVPLAIGQGRLRSDPCRRVPNLAVLIPVYNAVEDLARTLDSVDAQGCDLDIVVVDDGSIPPTLIDPARYVHPVVLLRQPVNRGVTAALNVGLRYVLSRPYTYVARQDAGDLDLGDRLSTQLAYLEAHPEVALVGGFTRHVDANGRTLFHTHYPEHWGAIRRRMRYRTAFSHPTCMMRTSVLRAVGYYDESVDLAQDYDLFRRVAEKFPCANVPKVLVSRSESGPSVVRVHRRAAERDRIVVQLRYFSPYDVHCYLGLVRSAIVYLVPRRIAQGLRRRWGITR